MGLASFTCAALSFRSMSVSSVQPEAGEPFGRYPPPAGSAGPFRKHFEQVTARVMEVKSAAGAALADLHIVERRRPAAVFQPLLAHPSEDLVELLFRHPK